MRDAPAGQNGPEVCQDTSGPNPLVFQCMLSPSLVTELLKGNIYVTVLTTPFPEGEIRGQLQVVP